VRRRVADGRDGLRRWRLAANILNKQPRTDDKGLSSSLGVGSGTITPEINKPSFTESHKEPRT
jgi:hypothetical protein